MILEFQSVQSYNSGFSSTAVMKQKLASFSILSGKQMPNTNQQIATVLSIEEAVRNFNFNFHLLRLDKITAKRERGDCKLSFRFHFLTSCFSGKVLKQKYTTRNIS